MPEITPSLQEIGLREDPTPKEDTIDQQGGRLSASIDDSRLSPFEDTVEIASEKSPESTYLSSVEWNTTPLSGIEYSSEIPPGTDSPREYRDGELGNPIPGHIIRIPSDIAQRHGLRMFYQCDGNIHIAVSTEEINWYQEHQDKHDSDVARSIAARVSLLQSLQSATDEEGIEAAVSAYKEAMLLVGNGDSVYGEGGGNAWEEKGEASDKPQPSPESESGLTDDAVQPSGELDGSPSTADQYDQGLATPPSALESRTDPKPMDVGPRAGFQRVETRKGVHPINVVGPISLGNLSATGAESAGSTTLAKTGEDANNKSSEDYLIVHNREVMINGVPYMVAIVVDGAGGGAKGLECAETGGASMLQEIETLASEGRHPREILGQASIRANDSVYSIASGEGGAALAVALIPTSGAGEVHTGTIGNCFVALDGVMMTKQDGYYEKRSDGTKRWVTPALGANGALQYKTFQLNLGQQINLGSDGLNDEQAPHSPSTLSSILMRDATETVEEAAKMSPDHIANIRIESRRFSTN